MEQVIFEVDNTRDANLLIAIAEKLGISKHQISQKTENENQDDKEKYFKIIDKGTDVSNFGDPSSWQRKTRRDRTLIKKLR